LDTSVIYVYIANCRPLGSVYFEAALTFKNSSITESDVFTFKPFFYK